MKKIKEPKFPKDYDFNEMVDMLAGTALLNLIKGENWRLIVWSICYGAVQWHEGLHKK